MSSILPFFIHGPSSSTSNHYTFAENHSNRPNSHRTTRALVNLNTYFSDSKHWSAVWTCRTVKDAWRNLWISQDLVSPTPSERWFQTEIPTVSQLDAALELWFRYLFIFSIPVPEKIPAVFQASHHSVSASYGIVCKIKKGCTLQIWDHAISWRETNLYLSSDLCQMAPFIVGSLTELSTIVTDLSSVAKFSVGIDANYQPTYPSSRRHDSPLRRFFQPWMGIGDRY